MKATQFETKVLLDAVARKKGFQCVNVSWEDAQRGTVDGVVSCWGSNISDVRLCEKGGQLLYTLRSQNWNERLGYVSTKDVAVVVGNEVAGGAPPTPVTLESYLKGIGSYGAYAGVQAADLYEAGVDGLATIRFQSVFLPIANSEVTEFCTEVYNYNTRSNDDPRNMALLCTAQGTNVQQDGAGTKRIFLHAVDDDSTVHRYWMEAERSKHKVGGEQKETEEEAKEAASRGKATSIHIGTRAMGTRFNVQMLIQVPLKQKPKHVCNQVPPKQKPKHVRNPPVNPPLLGGDSVPKFKTSGAVTSAGGRRRLGTSNAARVSRGTEVGVWSGVKSKVPERDPSQHITITVTLYYTVAGGVPSQADIESCVKDLDELYKACPSDKKLVDCDEVTAEIAVKNRGYTPAVQMPIKSAFPE